MKILLVYPYFIDNRINEEDVSAIPMGLYYVGAMLRANGYAVDILNGHNLGHAPHRIYQVLGDKRPDVVGFSILHANRWGGIDIARMVKKVNPGATVVFGGVGATFLWEHLLTHFPEIDYVVRGEGEHTFLELIRFLERKKTTAPTHIDGLAFRKAGKPLTTGDREPAEDLDSLPMPADHFTFQHLSLTRGCPSGCTFCGSPAFWKRRVRFHGADYFVTQMEKLREKGGHLLFCIRRHIYPQPGTGDRHLPPNRRSPSRCALGGHFPGGLCRRRDVVLDAPGRMHTDQLRSGERQP